MGTKVWTFLLPNSGKHQLRVEEIGTPGQRAFVNGELQTLREGARVFAGPGNSLLELKGQGAQWSLFVNGLRVEDYEANRRKTGDESLRELRSKPDGSYLISPEFEAVDLELNTIRKFRFRALGQEHEVHVAHWDCIWQVIADGMLVERVAHTLHDDYGDARFDFRAGEGGTVKAVCKMQWLTKAAVWNYTLTVNGVEIPVCWTKAAGDVAAAPGLVEVMGPAPPEAAAAAAGPSAEGAAHDEPQPPETLPQGVSFDRLSGAYQANIRAASGKFVFLGEFGTPEAAHQRYLEAVPVHCPDKKIAPDLIT